MVDGQGDVHRILEQRRDRQTAPMGEEARHGILDAREREEQRQVELTGPQSRGDPVRLTLGERQLHVRVSAAEGGDRLGHQRRTGAGEDRDPQAAAVQAQHGMEVLLGRLDLGEDEIGVGEQALARRRGARPAAISHHQRGSELLLQACDGLGHGRLGVLQRVGRSGEGALFDDFLQDAKAGEIQH